MRTPWAMLPVVAFLSVIDAFSAVEEATTSKGTAREVPSFIGPHDSTQPQESFLRNSGVTDTDTDNEEKIALPGISNIANLVSDYSPKVAHQLLLQQRTSPTLVFNLQHAKMRNNMGTNIEKNTELLDWLRYTMKYREMMGGSKYYKDGEIYVRLLNLAPETTLAFFFQSLRRIPDLKILGENLQKAQYKFWRMLGIEPSDVAKSLGITEMLESGKVMSDPRYIIYFDFAEEWLRKVTLA